MPQPLKDVIITGLHLKLTDEFLAQLKKTVADNAGKPPAATSTYVVRGTAFHIGGSDKKEAFDLLKNLPGKNEKPVISITTAIPRETVLDADRHPGTLYLPKIKGDFLFSGAFSGKDPRPYCAIDGTAEQKQYFKSATDRRARVPSPCITCKCPDKKP